MAFRGNRYSLNPGMGGIDVTLRHRLGTNTVEIVSAAGQVLVSHHLAAPGAGSMIRTPEHRAALEAVVLSQFTTAQPCDRKANRPPGAAAMAERAKLLGSARTEPSVDLDELAEVIRLAFPTTSLTGHEVPA